MGHSVLLTEDLDLYFPIWLDEKDIPDWIFYLVVQTPVAFVMPVIFCSLEIQELALKSALEPPLLPTLYQNKPANAGFMLIPVI